MTGHGGAVVLLAVVRGERQSGDRLSVSSTKQPRPQRWAVAGAWTRMRKASHRRRLPSPSVATRQANNRRVVVVLAKVRAEREPGAALSKGLRRDFLATGSREIGQP